MTFLAFAFLAAAAAQTPHVAVVYAVRGDVRVTAADGSAAVVSQLTWLDAPSTISSAGGARVAVAFENGKRFELIDRARATVAADRLIRKEGTVRELPWVPPLPKLAPITVTAPVSVPGAARIRGEHKITDLYPRNDAAAIADETVLTFAAPVMIRDVDVTVTDAEGKVVFETTTSDRRIALPRGALKDGSAYRWSVARTDDAETADAQFVTLSKEQRLRRAALHDALKAPDAEQLALAAAVDVCLGLQREAVAELERALAMSPHDAAIAQTLAHARETMSR